MLVSVDELTSYMSGLQMTRPQKASAQRTLNAVQLELETYLNRPLELVQIRETKRTDELGWVNPSITPVKKVIASLCHAWCASRRSAAQRNLTAGSMGT